MQLLKKDATVDFLSEVFQLSRIAANSSLVYAQRRDLKSGSTWKKKLSRTPQWRYNYKETRSFNQIHVAYVIGKDSFIQNLDQ